MLVPVSNCMISSLYYFKMPLWSHLLYVFESGFFQVGSMVKFVLSFWDWFLQYGELPFVNDHQMWCNMIKKSMKYFVAISICVPIESVFPTIPGMNGYFEIANIYPHDMLFIPIANYVTLLSAKIYRWMTICRTCHDWKPFLKASTTINPNKNHDSGVAYSLQNKVTWSVIPSWTVSPLENDIQMNPISVPMCLL